MIIKIVNNKIISYSIEQFRLDNRMTSYGAYISEDILNAQNVYRVSPTNKPVVDYTKNITEGTPVYVNGAWLQNWVISDASQEEIDSRIENLKRQINNERDRRINLSKSVSLTSGKSFTVDMSNGGRQNIGDLGTAALAKASINDTSTISFRDADNVDWDLTNEDIIEMGLQVTAQVSAIHVKARAIKALDPIPTDYTDDSYWQ